MNANVNVSVQCEYKYEHLKDISEDKFEPNNYDFVDTFMCVNRTGRYQFRIVST